MRSSIESELHRVEVGLRRETSKALGTVSLGGGASVELWNSRSEPQAPSSIAGEKQRGVFRRDGELWVWRPGLILRGPDDDSGPVASYGFLGGFGPGIFSPDTSFPSPDCSALEVTHKSERRIGNSRLSLITTFTLTQGQQLTSIVQRIWEVSNPVHYLELRLDLGLPPSLEIATSPHPKNRRRVRRRMEGFLDFLTEDIDPDKHLKRIFHNAQDGKYLLDRVGQPSNKLPLREVARIIKSK